MGSQGVEVLRQGIWASLTGGWFYDPHQHVFCNTFHLYLWLYLVCAPFFIYLYCGWWVAGWLVHLALLSVVAVGIKAVNHLLHHTFDTTDCLEEELTPPPLPPGGPPAADATATTATASASPAHYQAAAQQQRSRSFEAIEMQVVGGGQLGGGGEGVTPPVGCSSRNSVMDAGSQPPATMIDLKADVHHKDSSGSEEGSKGDAAAALTAAPPRDLKDLPRGDRRTRGKGQRSNRAAQKGNKRHKINNKIQHKLNKKIQHKINNKI
ncbi:Protein pecanex [Chionoecetes opilio]|uniref:Pecanex-like protein n=1 Tax=Chionoecetes opilio TaxID=41210 RepID=A0A8J5D098_CHIOP|nr:Protein pecanex [Chionoecetes opilio]